MIQNSHTDETAPESHIEKALWAVWSHSTKIQDVDTKCRAEEQ